MYVHYQANIKITLYSGDAIGINCTKEHSSKVKELGISFLVICIPLSGDRFLSTKSVVMISVGIL